MPLAAPPATAVPAADSARPARHVLSGRRSTREAVGIDVGVTGITTAQVVRRRDGWHWTARGAVAYPQQSVAAVRKTGEGSTATPPDVVGANVAYSLPQPADGRRRVAAVVLPSTVAVLRTPSESADGNFNASILSDLGAAVSPHGSVQSCSWSIGETSRRMVYAVSGSAAEATAEAIYRAGYTCRRIDSRPHAIARALALDAIGDARIAIDWGWSDCMLTFAHEDPTSPFFRPSLCRYLRGYGLEAASRIAGREEEDQPNSLMQAMLPANSLECRRRDDQNRELLRPLARAAAGELIRSFRLAESLRGVDTSGPVVLCGAAAAVAQLPELLAESLGRPVRRWRWGGRSRPLDHDRAPDDCLFAIPLSLACGETLR